MADSFEFVRKRDGRQVSFDRDKIRNAIKKAFLANSISDETIYSKLTIEVLDSLRSKYPVEHIPTIEEIQDVVEDTLIKNDHAMVAKSYILYREKQKEQREEKVLEGIDKHRLKVKHGEKEEVFNIENIQKNLVNLSSGLKVDVKSLIEDIIKNVYDGISVEEIHDLVLNAVKSKIEVHYDYSYLASRVVINNQYEEILSVSFSSDELEENYRNRFREYVKEGIDLELLSKDLLKFDFDKISKAIEPKRDKLFMFLGMQTIIDRYLLRRRKKHDVFELPQWMWMRVSMGLSINEKEPEEKAIEFYNTLSNMYMVSSTPTLFNSGTTHSQLSSCYINIVGDSLTEIFKNFSDCAQLSKWAGGIGTDWTPVRAKGSKIKGTNGDSQGIIPFIKIYNDVALAVNQGGKRRGAMAAYLEIWHRDIEEFMDLKKNTGDERRRAHDIHTACFIPDLFMKRVENREDWTLFSPNEAKELYNSYGKEFEKNYIELERKEDIHKITISAIELWKKLLTKLYETGHPWITFKDSINVRNTQDHVGMIHSSNLCTEITLNTSEKETAVCNLGSINIAKMIKDKKIDEELLHKTVSTAMRMLDNVVDVNFYPTVEANNSNLKHRPVGFGIMGYQDALYKMEIDFDSDENIEFSDMIMEMISYYAIETSSKIAKEKGKYESYAGSKWDRGIFPLDSLSLLEEERGRKLKVNKESRMDWNRLKSLVKENGMRNSNCMAIAPTATIANITGTTPTIEPMYKNIYMKENLSGNFIIINKFLIDSLEKIGLWNQDMVNKLKLNNGSVLGIDEIPADIRRRFKESFEIDPIWIIKTAAVRGKWIDQSQSTNIFLKTTSGKIVNDIYQNAWEYGLKTTYYLRTLAASQVTKTISTQSQPDETELKACSISDPDCEVCQ